MKKLRNEIADVKKDFDNVDNEVAEEMYKVMPILIDLIIKVGAIPQKRLSRFNQTLTKYSSLLDSYKSISQRSFTRQDVPIGTAFFAAVKTDELAITESQLINASLINQNFESYINSFRYGSPEHSGWSMGLERFTMALLNLDNIREATMFVRDRDRLTP